MIFCEHCHTYVIFKIFEFFSFVHWRVWSINCKTVHISEETISWFKNYSPFRNLFDTFQYIMYIRYKKKIFYKCNAGGIVHKIILFWLVFSRCTGKDPVSKSIRSQLILYSSYIKWSTRKRKNFFLRNNTVRQSVKINRNLYICVRKPIFEYFFSSYSIRMNSLYTECMH